MHAPLDRRRRSCGPRDLLILAFIALATFTFALQPAGGAHRPGSRHMLAGSVASRVECLHSTRFGLRACSVQHGCTEGATHATPRTASTLANPEQCLQWARARLANVRAAERFGAWAREHGSRPTLVMLGDSITEEMAGTKLGLPAARCAGVPEALARLLGSSFATLPLGISGDMTQHLLWRLRNGELPAHALGPNAPLAIVSVLIGTNNLAYGHAPPDVLRGIDAVASHVLSASRSALLAINTLLPRADGQLKPRVLQRVARLCPPRCEPDGTPLRSFEPLVTEVNAGLPALVQRLRALHPGRVIRLVNCSSELLLLGGPKQSAGDRGVSVNISLMPDLLHPNAAGFERILACQRRAFLAMVAQQH